MLSLIESIFGSYEPITYQVYNSVSDTVESIIPSGMAGVNWPYVLAVALFGMVLYCILRMLGGVLVGK